MNLTRAARPHGTYQSLLAHKSCFQSPWKGRTIWSHLPKQGHICLPHHHLRTEEESRGLTFPWCCPGAPCNHSSPADLVLQFSWPPADTFWFPSGSSHPKLHTTLLHPDTTLLSARSPAQITSSSNFSFFQPSELLFQLPADEAFFFSSSFLAFCCSFLRLFFWQRSTLKLLLHVSSQILTPSHRNTWQIVLKCFFLNTSWRAVLPCCSHRGLLLATGPTWSLATHPWWHLPMLRDAKADRGCQ